MQKRKTMDKIPIQANFYPLPSMAFLQDKSTRLTLLSAQPNGVAGLHQGNTVIMARIWRFLYYDKFKEGRKLMRKKCWSIKNHLLFDP